MSNAWSLTHGTSILLQRPRELEHAQHSLGRRSLNVCTVAEGAITPNFPWSPACLHRDVQTTCITGLAGFHQGASWQCDDPRWLTSWSAQRIRHMYLLGLFASSGTTALGLTFSMEDSKTLPMFWIFSLILFLFLFFFFPNGKGWGVSLTCKSASFCHEKAWRREIHVHSKMLSPT